MHEVAGEPGILEQTRELGAILKQIMDDDPRGTPAEQVASVFAGWLAVCGPVSNQPVRFADVADNFDVRHNTNKDLFDLFVMLEGYIPVEEPAPEPLRTFIGLPVIE